MNIIISVLFLFFNSSFVTKNITPEEVAARYCNCSVENNLVVAAKKYQSATEAQLKENAKTEYVVSFRKTQDCIKMQEIQQAVRELPTDQRVQFEKNVMKILTENCSEVANALQILK